MHDDVVVSTGLPRSILDPNTGSFGNSGINLTQQFKPFARDVYLHQSNYLYPLIQSCKIDMIQSGKFNLDELNFTLSMPYPESQTDRDLISSQSDLLRLANDVLDSVGEKLLGGDMDSLPVELVRDVYTQILPYDSERIDGWIKTAEKSKKENAEFEEKSDNSFRIVERKNRKDWKLIERKMTRTGINDLIQETIYDQKKESLKTEGVAGNSHYFSSKSVYKDFDVKDLIEKKKVSALKKMNEGNDNINHLKEELRIKKEKKQENKEKLKDDRKDRY